MVATRYRTVNSDLLPLGAVADCYIHPMTSDEIRLANLRTLIARSGGTPMALEQYCAKHGLTISRKYISQILSGFQGKRDRKPRTVGTDISRRLEQAFREAPGWMDNNHSDADATATPATFQVNDLAAKPYDCERHTLTDDEEVIVKGFGLFGPELREHWLQTAKAYIAAKQQREDERNAA